MKTFRNFLNEETMPFAGTSKGVIDVRDPAVRDSINMQLTAMTGGKFITPYIALERVSKALANFHIFLPKYSFLEGDSGMATFEVNQFGLKIGQTDDGRVVTAEDDEKFFIYFEYRMSDCGMFKVFAELVDADELEEIMDDVEAELSGETEEDEDLYEEAETAFPETGTRPTPGSQQPAIVTGVTIPDELEGKNRDKMKSKLEKKSLEELNMSDEQQMDDKKLDEEQINELSSKTYKSAMNKAANKAMWSATKKGYSKYSDMARKFQKKGMEQEKKEKNQVDESDDWFFKKDKKPKEKSVIDMERPKTKKPSKSGETYVHDTSGKVIVTTGGKPSDEWKKLKEEQIDEVSKALAYRAAVSAFTAADKAKIADKKLGMFDTSQHNKRMKKDAQGKKFLNYMSKKVDEEHIDEVSAELVGKVNKARLEKPSKTAAADQTRNRAVKKAWLKSKVGELKK